MENKINTSLSFVNVRFWNWMTQPKWNRHKNMQANGANFQSRKRVLKMTQTRKVIDAQSIEEEGLIEKQKDHSIRKTKGSRKLSLKTWNKTDNNQRDLFLNRRLSVQEHLETLRSEKTPTRQWTNDWGKQVYSSLHSLQRLKHTKK